MVWNVVKTAASCPNAAAAKNVTAPFRRQLHRGAESGVREAEAAVDHRNQCTGDPRAAGGGALFVERGLRKPRVPAGERLQRQIPEGSGYLSGKSGGKAGSERCYGVVAEETFLLVCEYGRHGERPELVMFRRRGLAE